ncbi:hypothetical protein SLE2022_165520 [Rubroshorea leprosula]
MEYQKDYLRRVGCEGFEIIDAFYGPSRNPPPPPPPPLPEYHPQQCKYVYNGPRTQTVLQERFSNSTTYVYQVPTQVAAGKQAFQASVPASKEVIFNSNGRRNAYQVPQIAKPKEPVTWYICKVPQAYAGNEDIITSDQAAKNYGGLISKEYYW